MILWFQTVYMSHTSTGYIPTGKVGNCREEWRTCSFPLCWLRVGLPGQPAPDTCDQKEADTCCAEITEHPAMETQMTGAKTVLLGKRQLCCVSGKTRKPKGENASWLQQKSNILMLFLSTRLWPRRIIGCGLFPGVRMRCSSCNETWSCDLPGLHMLLTVAGCYSVWQSMSS